MYRSQIRTNKLKTWQYLIEKVRTRLGKRRVVRYSSEIHLEGREITQGTWILKTGLVQCAVNIWEGKYTVQLDTKSIPLFAFVSPTLPGYISSLLHLIDQLTTVLWIITGIQFRGPVRLVRLCTFSRTERERDRDSLLSIRIEWNVTRQEMYIWRNMRARSRNHSCRCKRNITYSENVFLALVTKHSKRMRRIILSSVACLALPYFPTLSHIRNDFRGGGVIEHTGVLISP